MHVFSRKKERPLRFFHLARMAKGDVNDFSGVEELEEFVSRRKREHMVRGTEDFLMLGIADFHEPQGEHLVLPRGSHWETGILGF